MTMTVAGHYRIPYEEAEVLKTTPEKEKEIFPVIKATVEKMASITEKFLKGYEIPAAVSYTHLDVYKRQDFELPIAP